MTTLGEIQERRKRWYIWWTRRLLAAIFMTFTTSPCMALAWLGFKVAMWISGDGPVEMSLKDMAWGQWSGAFRWYRGEDGPA